MNEPEGDAPHTVNSDAERVRAWGNAALPAGATAVPSFFAADDFGSPSRAVMGTPSIAVAVAGLRAEAAIPENRH